MSNTDPIKVLADATMRTFAAVFRGSTQLKRRLDELGPDCFLDEATRACRAELIAFLRAGDALERLEQAGDGPLGELAAKTELLGIAQGISGRLLDPCRCGHIRHPAQCLAAEGCWCDTREAPTC